MGVCKIQVKMELVLQNVSAGSSELICAVIGVAPSRVVVMSGSYLVNELAHLGDPGSSSLETLQVVGREDEVALLPLREELVSLLPEKTFSHCGCGPLFLAIDKSTINMAKLITDVSGVHFHTYQT